LTRQWSVSCQAFHRSRHLLPLLLEWAPRRYEFSRPAVRCLRGAVRAAGCAWFQKRILRSFPNLDSTIRLSPEPGQPLWDELVAEHPDRTIFASFPGAGRATVPRLIVAFGTCRERYQSAFEVECNSAIAPGHIASGKTDRVSVRHACQKFTRQTFQEFAGQTIPHRAWAKAYYQAHCHRPEQHHAAVRALAFKWIRILFRCWKDRRPYDEQLYLMSVRRRRGQLGTALASVTCAEWKTTAGFSKLAEKHS